VQRIIGTIEGLTDILFNRMVDPTVLDSGTTGGAPATKEGRIDEAWLKVYQTADGYLYWPGWNFKRMTLDGCARSKMRVHKERLFDLVNAGMFPDHELRFKQRKPDFFHEVTGKIPPKRGAAAIIRRPALKAGWQLSFGLTLVLPIPEELIRRVIEVAGLKVGMGSWRPEHGRFLVRMWQVEGEVEALELPAEHELVGKKKT
jgi:hypothetical protein